uniref:DNA mismatch repair protein Mlh1 n=1 Tax=Lygus hesperus TaxID=30085 RepID=A0A0A9Y6X6_LYGHE
MQPYVVGMNPPMMPQQYVYMMQPGPQTMGSPLPGNQDARPQSYVNYNQTLQQGGAARSQVNATTNPPNPTDVEASIWNMDLDAAKNTHDGTRAPSNTGALEDASKDDDDAFKGLTVNW